MSDFEWIYCVTHVVDVIEPVRAALINLPFLFVSDGQRNILVGSVPPH